MANFKGTKDTFLAALMAGAPAPANLKVSAETPAERLANEVANNVAEVEASGIHPALMQAVTLNNLNGFLGRMISIRSVAGKLMAAFSKVVPNFGAPVFNF